MGTQQAQRPRLWRIAVFLWAVGLILLHVGSTRPALAAAVLRNVGHCELTAQAVQNNGLCMDGNLQTVSQHLVKAMQLEPETVSSWRTLLRVMGLVDRQWIVSQVRMSQDLSSGDLHNLALELAKESLLPPPAAMEKDWTPYRCLTAWSAWTLGLVDATLGQWETATAAYQAGIGLAPGRVPAGIVKEYYSTLARYLLAATAVSPAQQLAAAKYLALAGATDEAAARFEALAGDERLSPQQRCEAQRGVQWLQSGGDSTERVPPWPVTLGDGDQPCGSEARAPLSTAAGWSPQWVLTSSTAITDGALGNTLLGFDLDADVLDAGVEVIGRLYWRTAEGTVVSQGFRQTNLWPNSGNSWLPLAGFSTCLPGYEEPPWVSHCASGVSVPDASEDRRSPVGYLHSPMGEYGDTAPEAIPDANLTTTSFPVSADAMVVYGGWFRVEGTFPWPHMARSYAGGDPLRSADSQLSYEPVLNLTSQPVGVWQATVNVAPPTQGNYDLLGWLRPRSGRGAGTLEFDDVFSFALPIR